MHLQYSTIIQQPQIKSRIFLILRHTTHFLGFRKIKHLFIFNFQLNSVNKTLIEYVKRNYKLFTFGIILRKQYFVCLRKDWFYRNNMTLSHYGSATPVQKSTRIDQLCKQLPVSRFSSACCVQNDTLQIPDLRSGTFQGKPFKYENKCIIHLCLSIKRIVYLQEKRYISPKDDCFD